MSIRHHRLPLPTAIALVAALAVTGTASAQRASARRGDASHRALADSTLRYAQAQLRRTADSLDPARGYPTSTTPDGAWRQSRATDWRSGFFPGELWYMYQLTHEPYWRTQAERWTAGIEVADTMTTTHDLGFMIFDSFGHEYALTRDPHAKQVIMTAAAHLAGRFNPKVGATQSWDVHATRGPRASWKFPVIVDNLMNLPLLFWASSHGGDPAWRRMAERHALTSLHAHLRPDGSTAHVALFDPETGALERTVTAQGYSDSSVWSRGQAWAIYGFGSAYRQTHDRRLLDGAERAADWFISHLPPDGVPYWDFSDPAIPDAPRDASAAAIAASGLLQLARVTSGPASRRYRLAAEHILTSLCTSYLSRGTPNAAIVLHSTGAKPANSEVDVGMIYADYYLIEALLRLRGVVA